MLKEILATGATILVTSSYIPQIAKGLATKSMKDVSMMFLLAIAAGVILWIAYAYVNGDTVFLISNCITGSFAVILIGMKLHYDKGVFGKAPFKPKNP
jgi:MtN3 and saliva related transmembrane protein